MCICTLGKKENKYIREYIGHYKALGVDKIFLYDNNDIDDEKFEDVLSDYVSIFKHFISYYLLTLMICS